MACYGMKKLLLELLLNGRKITNVTSQLMAKYSRLFKRLGTRCVDVEIVSQPDNFYNFINDYLCPVASNKT